MLKEKITKYSIVSVPGSIMLHIVNQAEIKSPNLRFILVFS